MCGSFSFIPLTLYRSPEVVVRCGVRENVLEPMFRAQPVSKPEPLDWDLHNGFSASCPPQVRQEDWRNLELGISLPRQVCWALIRPQQVRLWLNRFRRAGLVKKYRVPPRLSKWFLSPSMPGA